MRGGEGSRMVEEMDKEKDHQGKALKCGGHRVNDPIGLINRSLEGEGSPGQKHHRCPNSSSVIIYLRSSSLLDPQPGSNLSLSRVSCFDIPNE